MHPQGTGISMKKWIISVAVSALMFASSTQASMDDFEDNSLMGAGAHVMTPEQGH